MVVPESPTGLVNVFPPFMRDWFGLPGAALKCCVSTRPPEDEREIRFVTSVQVFLVLPLSDWFEPGRSNMGTCGVGMMMKDVANPTYNGYNVSVATLSAGGPADNSKQIQPGDILLRVDGRDVGPHMPQVVRTWPRPCIQSMTAEWVSRN